MQSPKRLIALLTPLAVAAVVSFGTEASPSADSAAADRGPTVASGSDRAAWTGEPPFGEPLFADLLPLPSDDPGRPAASIFDDFAGPDDGFEPTGEVALFQLQVDPDGRIVDGAGTADPSSLSFWIPGADRERSELTFVGARNDRADRIRGLRPRDLMFEPGELDRRPVRMDWSYTERSGYVGGPDLLQLGDPDGRTRPDLVDLLANMSIETLTEHALSGSANMVFSAFTDLSLFVDYRVGNDRDPFALEFFVETRF